MSGVSQDQGEKKKRKRENMHRLELQGAERDAEDGVLKPQRRPRL